MTSMLWPYARGLGIVVFCCGLPLVDLSTYSALSIYRGIFSLNNSDKTPHSSPKMASYGVSFMNSQYN